jgi:hypothetical protein
MHARVSLAGSMPVQVNLFLGAAGLVIALLTGSYIASDWRGLTGLETWEVRFEEHTVPLPDRAAALAQGEKRTETHAIASENLTFLRVDLTWSDPALGAPEIHLRVKDPAGKVRIEERHTGGATGIHVPLQLLSKGDIPRGRIAFDARSTDVETRFDERWPAHPEGRGNWTFEIDASASAPPPGAGVAYELRVAYQYYEGALRPAPEAVR